MRKYMETVLCLSRVEESVTVWIEAYDNGGRIELNPGSAVAY